MIRKLTPVVLVSVSLGVLSVPADANDTELTYGGTPRALNGNTTVSMKSESVKIIIGEKWVTVDCLFHFENRGAARKVRMGFPDEGAEPDDASNTNPKTLKGTFATFESGVNGKPVKTTVINADDMGSVWHEKKVEFPAHSRLEVRDRYTVEVGNSIAFFPVSVNLARYILHTGASWHGTIGRSEVEIVFQRKSMRVPIRVKRLPKGDRRPGSATPPGLDARYLYFQGPSTPTVSGKTLRFVRTDWRPKPDDDVLLLFDLKGPKTTDAP